MDCVRLLHGGFYGHMGVAVPAHPPQASVLGCLKLSKAGVRRQFILVLLAHLICRFLAVFLRQVLNVTSNPEDDQTNGAWDASPTTQYAFCNNLSVNYQGEVR